MNNLLKILTTFFFGITSNISLYYFDIFEKAKIPLILRFFKQKELHPYVLIAFYYFFTNTVFVFLSLFLQDDFWKFYSLCKKKEMKTEMSFKRRLLNSRRILLDGFPAVVAILFTSKMCSLDLNKQTFFMTMFIYFKLCVIDIFILKLFFLLDFVFASAEISALLIFLFSILKNQSSIFVKVASFLKKDKFV